MDQWKLVFLHGVLYIPCVANVFSEQCLAGKGYKIVKDEKTVDFQSQFNDGPWGILVGNLWLMLFRQSPGEHIQPQLKTHERMSTGQMTRFVPSVESLPRNPIIGTAARFQFPMNEQYKIYI